MKSLGANPLTQLRKARKLSLMLVASAVGTVESHLSKVERGLAKPSPELANKLAQYFDNAITRDQILFPEDYATPGKKPVRRAQPQPEAVEVR